METWSYQRNGAIEGPVSADELKALYQADEITLETLVRSATAGGGWRRYGSVSGLAPSRIPRAVRKLWPWFIFGIPLAGGALDTLLIRSSGSEFVAANAAWLSYAPTALTILGVILWLSLIAKETRKQRKATTGLAIWVIAAPLYLTFSWWTTVLASGLINVPFGFRIPSCQADITKGQVKEAFEKAVARSGDAGASAVDLTDARQQWLAGRIRMCTGKVETSNARTYSVRYEIEDHGNRLFLRTMHRFYVTLAIQ